MPDETPTRKPNGQRGGEAPGPLKFSRSIMAWVIFIGMALLLMAVAFRNVHRREEISVDQFWTYVDNNQITDVVLSGPDDTIYGKFKENVPGRSTNAPSQFKLGYNVKSEYLEKRWKRRIFRTGMSPAAAGGTFCPTCCCGRCCWVWCTSSSSASSAAPAGAPAF